MTKRKGGQPADGKEREQSGEKNWSVANRRKNVKEKANA